MTAKDFAKAVYFLSISLLGSYILAVVLIANTGLDIQLHDTYITVDRLTITLLLAAPIILTVFLVKGAIEDFRILATNLGIATGLLLALSLTAAIAKIWTDARLIACFEVCCLILLAIRTFRFAK